MAALFAWLLTAAGGLVLLMIWIIEYDREFQSTAATRLPVPVISAHAALALAGLLAWFAYLLAGRDELAWTSVAVLAVVAGLGLVMAARWVQVYRTHPQPGRSAVIRKTVPPERNFPLPLVIAHGLLGLTTIALVLLSTLGRS